MDKYPVNKHIQLLMLKFKKKGEQRDIKGKSIDVSSFSFPKVKAFKCKTLISKLPSPIKSTGSNRKWQCVLAQILGSQSG